MGKNSYKIKDMKPLLSSCVPVSDILDLKDTSTLYKMICDMYSKYGHVIRDNIRKLNSPSVNKMILRTRTLIGSFAIDSVPVSNNVYVELPPVFYMFGLLLPFITRILQVDLYGMFEQLSQLSETKQLNDNEMKLIKMSMMNDVKIMDLDDMPLTYEEQINVLVYLNIFYHVVASALFKIDKESIPKMVEQNLLNQFNSIMDTKYKMPCIYDKLNDNDPYNVKVIRKTLLSFGIRPVKLRLRNYPIHSKGTFPAFPAGLNSTCSNDELEEFVDSVCVPHDKLDDIDYFSDAPDDAKFDIKKFLEKQYKIITVDNKIYWSHFDRAYGIFPLFIGRHDLRKKKDYEQLLVANVECCETRFNTRQLNDKYLFCTSYGTASISSPSSSNPGLITSAELSVHGFTYLPFALMGTFLSNGDLTGSIEDVEFLFINPYNEFPNEQDGTSIFKKDQRCEKIFELLKKFDEHFFCGKTMLKNKYDCDKNGPTSIESILEGDMRCCDQSVFNEFKQVLEVGNVGLLFLSNKSCASPIFVDMLSTTGGSSVKIGGKDVKILPLSSVRCLIASSVTTIMYITDISC